MIITCYYLLFIIGVVVYFNFILQIENLIHLLFSKLKELYDVDSPRLSKTHKEMIYNSLQALNKSALKIIYVNLEKTFENIEIEETVETEADVLLEIELVDKYKEYLKKVTEDETVTKHVQEESMSFVRSIQALPFYSENVQSDIYYEPFITKMVHHMKSQIQHLPDEKRLDYRCTKSTVWLLKVFRTMIGT